MTEINALIYLLAIQPEVPIRFVKMLTRCLKMSTQIGHMNLEGINFFQLLFIKFQLYLFNINFEVFIDHLPWERTPNSHLASQG